MKIFIFGLRPKDCISWCTKGGWLIVTDPGLGVHGRGGINVPYGRRFKAGLGF